MQTQLSTSRSPSIQPPPTHPNKHPVPTSTTQTTLSEPPTVATSHITSATLRSRTPMENTTPFTISIPKPPIPFPDLNVGCWYSVVIDLWGIQDLKKTVKHHVFVKSLTPLRNPLVRFYSSTTFNNTDPVSFYGEGVRDALCYAPLQTTHPSLPGVLALPTYPPVIKGFLDLTRSHQVIYESDLPSRQQLRAPNEATPMGSSPLRNPPAHKEVASPDWVSKYCSLLSTGVADVDTWERGWDLFLTECNEKVKDQRHLETADWGNEWGGIAEDSVGERRSGRRSGRGGQGGDGGGNGGGTRGECGGPGGDGRGGKQTARTGGSWTNGRQVNIHGHPPTANKTRSGASFYPTPTKPPSFKSTNSSPVLEKMLAHVRNGNPNLKISVQFHEPTPGDEQEPMSQALMQRLDYEGYKQIPSP